LHPRGSDVARVFYLSERKQAKRGLLLPDWLRIINLYALVHHEISPGDF
jgi:hypothetical protein